MSKTLILGDPHLGRSLTLGKVGIGNTLNSRIIDQLNILEWILSRAIEFEVSNIIITGDVFHDAKPHPTIITLLLSWLKKCTDNDIHVHIISGNHDVIRSGQFYMSALDVISAADIEGVHVYKNLTTLNTRGASFSLMPFRDKRYFNNATNTEAVAIVGNKMPYELAGIDIANAKIVIGHMAIEGCIPVGDEIDDIQNELFCSVSMFKGYDFVWMGHVHKPQIVSKSPFVAHIGSMDLSDFGETDHTKIAILFDSDKSEPYKYLEIPTRPLNQISISVPESITDTTSYVLECIKSEKNISKSIVKVNITFENPDVVNVNRSVVEKSLLEQGAFHITRINEERKIALIKRTAVLESVDNTVNESAAIKMFADANIDESIRQDFINVANSIIEECSESKG